MFCEHFTDVEALYTVGRKLGVGNFAKVVQASCNFAMPQHGLRAGAQVAVKIVKKPSRVSVDKVEMLQAEIDVLRTIDHPNLVRLYEVHETAAKLYLVMELCTGGAARRAPRARRAKRPSPGRARGRRPSFRAIPHTAPALTCTRRTRATPHDHGHRRRAPFPLPGELFDKIVTLGKYTEEDARLFAFKLLNAVLYLHDKNICHRDLKPENILLASPDEDAELCITDFGLGKARARNSNAPSAERPRAPRARARRIRAFALCTARSRTHPASASAPSAPAPIPPLPLRRCSSPPPRASPGARWRCARAAAHRATPRPR